MVAQESGATPGRVLWEALVDAFDASIQVVVCNLLWFFLSLPLVTAPAALAGLYHCSDTLARRRSAGRAEFFEGIRLYAWAAYRFVLLNLFVISVLAANFIFYGGIDQRWAAWAQGVAIGLLVLWLALNVFTFPLYMVQAEKKLLTALRNSLVLYLRFPGWCLSLLAFLLLLSAISTLLGPSWAFCSACLVLMLSCRFTHILLSQLGFDVTSQANL